MPVMNNKVRNVVFYSTRLIHPYFSDKEHLIPSNSLMDYFSSLQKDDNTKDEFSCWLSDLAFWFYYQQKLKDMCGAEDREKLEEILSEVTRTKNEDPHNTKSIEDCLESHENEQDLFWKKASTIFIELQSDYDKNVINFTPCLFDEYKEKLLSGKKTHLDRDFTESKNAGCNPDEGKAKLKHRLGIYHREDNEYAVAAVWPWPKGDTLEPNHDENWKAVAVKAIKELYPKCEEIFLVMHDNDFKWCQKSGIEKNQIVFKRRPLSNWDTDTKKDRCPSAEDPLISYIVFQHTNEHVMGPIKQKEHAPKDVWHAIDKYLRDVIKTLSEADMNKYIAVAHDKMV